MGRKEEFEQERERLNALVLKEATLSIKRFFALDCDVYANDALPWRTTDLSGLVASHVLRCEDCATYHLILAKRQGMTKEEVVEALAVGSAWGVRCHPSAPAGFRPAEALWGSALEASQP